MSDTSQSGSPFRRVATMFVPEKRESLKTTGEHQSVMEQDINKKLDKYFAMTEKALSLVTIVKKDKVADDFLSMAKNYLSDARHFRTKGDLLTALAAASYAHAWLDAGARLKLFEVDNSSDLFTVD
jgi:uncharacterized protein